MEPRTRKKKQNVRPFQTGTGQRNLSEEDRYAFDVAGFLILEGLLTNDQVRESRARLEATLSSPPSQVKREQNGPEVELLNVAECGGVLEGHVGLGSTAEGNGGAHLGKSNSPGGLPRDFQRPRYHR